MLKRKKPLVSINLVTWQAKPYLRSVLQSVINQTFTDYSILIIDNGSSDNTVKFIREYFPQFKTIAGKTNQGFAKAHNQAIHWTDSKYILCLNQDVVLHPDFLKNSLAYMEKTPEAAALTGKLLGWDKINELPTDRIDSIGLKILKNHRVIDRGQGEKDNGQYEEAQEIFGVSGACPIYRRESLNQVKISLEYFDEDFFSYKEDVDLAFRLRLAGFKSFYLPKAIAYHVRTAPGSEQADNKTVVKNRRQKNLFVNYHSYKNHFFVLVKNEFLSNIVHQFLRIFWYELKKFIYLVIFERSTLKAIFTFFKLYPKMRIKRQFIKKNLRTVDAKGLSQWYE